MEAKELMIGDWVLGKKKIPIKVEIINDNDKCINEVYCQGDIVDEIRETDIEPIPLYMEILIENGFKWIETWKSYCYFHNGKSLMVTYDKEKGFGIHGTTIRFRYVHELQRVMRVFGLNDLADNFKYE